MDVISDVTVGPCEKSRYITPVRINYKQNSEEKWWDLITEHDDNLDASFYLDNLLGNQNFQVNEAPLYFSIPVSNGVDKIWDAMEVHSSVCILVFNKTRKVFVFVKQFRPAVYLSRSETTEENGIQKIDSKVYPGSLGLTYELCAGIIDKDTSPQAIAQAELLEECGYQVPLDSIERVCSYRAGVGTTGALQTLFYAEVTDKMKVGKGGGLVEEGEMIDVVEVPLSEGMTLIMNDDINKPVGMMFGVMWFMQNKFKHFSDSGS